MKKFFRQICNSNDEKQEQRRKKKSSTDRLTIELCGSHASYRLKISFGPTKLSYLGVCFCFFFFYLLSYSSFHRFNMLTHTQHNRISRRYFHTEALPNQKHSINHNQKRINGQKHRNVLDYYSLCRNIKMHQKTFLFVLDRV